MKPLGKAPKPLTKAQEIFGAQFGNARILNERPADLRSDDPDKDKALFYNYRALRRQQAKVIKQVLR